VDVLRGVTLSVRKGERVSIMGAERRGQEHAAASAGRAGPASAGTGAFRGAGPLQLVGGARTVAGHPHRLVFQSYQLLPELDLVDNVLLPALSRSGGVASHGRPARAGAGPAGPGGAEGAGAPPAAGVVGRRAAAGGSGARPDERARPACWPTSRPATWIRAPASRCWTICLILVQESGHTLILVTHNEAVAALCKRQLVLRDGRWKAEEDLPMKIYLNGKLVPESQGEDIRVRPRLAVRGRRVRGHPGLQRPGVHAGGAH
jgi:predicted ABC-type transport system involved in lysophospholipase L1 biosynthesis ATPase subunit